MDSISAFWSGLRGSLAQVDGFSRVPLMCFASTGERKHTEDPFTARRGEGDGEVEGDGEGEEGD